MSHDKSSRSKKPALLALGGLLLIVAVAAVATRGAWWPMVDSRAHSAADASDPHEDHDDHDGHADHDPHDDHNDPDPHAGHSGPDHADDEAPQHAHAASGGDFIELSENGLKNIGYEPFEVVEEDFEKKLFLPAIVVERPGRSRIHITAPITGVVTQIDAVEGQAIEAASPMFEQRLTHEELVTAQRDYLKTAENLDVVNREIARLESLGEGVVAGRRILEQKYEKQKLEASLQAEQQALVVHGFTQEQVENVLQTHKLLREFVVRAPDHVHEGDSCQKDHLYHVQRLSVAQGQQVATGDELAIVADHCELFVEGQAFEDDAAGLRNAAQNGWEIDADLLLGDELTSSVSGLKLLYLADHVDSDSRAFRFYLQLPNEVVLDQTTPDGHRFIEWRFKPGQRMQLEVPVEKWEQQLVLPLDAIVDEVAESYVYQQNGDHFDQVSVHVIYRDQKSAVVANNGSIFPGDIVAGQGAYQMHLALKNKSGGGIDPHAGHNH